MGGFIPSISNTAFLLLLHIFLVQTCLYNHVAAAAGDPTATNGREREALEIGIGIGGGPDPPAPEASPPEPGDHDCGCQTPPPPPPPPLVFESERLKLVYPVIQSFKKKVKCDPFGVTKTWVGADICKYKGFRCATIPTYKQIALSDVQFNELNLGGDELTLDGFIDKLPDLSIFHANSNNFTGVIPKGVADIEFLFELDLSNNKFTGEFPYEVLGARNLTFLDLRFNSFAGVVPPQVFTLDVDVLFINNNNFQQKLPTNFGRLPALYITLANNKFTGEIPRSIGQARKTLTEILLLNNSLTGCLPCEIGYLYKLTLFDASRNQLTGPIPYSFGCLTNLEILNFDHNQLFGIIPDSVCCLPNLANLSLANNYFTGFGPSCWKLIHKGILDVRNNCIPWFPNQRSKAECEAFFCKPRWCPNQAKAMNWMPCSPNSRPKTLPKGEEEPPRPASPLSYHALKPHRP